MSMVVPDVARSLGALFVILAFGAAIGATVVMILADPATMRNLYRTQMWEEAVAAGVAERLETEQGPGYKWKGK